MLLTNVCPVNSVEKSAEVYGRASANQMGHGRAAVPARVLTGVLPSTRPQAHRPFSELQFPRSFAVGRAVGRRADPAI